MSPIEWYYAEEDQQVGPVTSSEIKRLAQSGRLKPDDLVWRDGMEMWMPARTVQGLFDGKPLAGSKSKPATKESEAADRRNKTPESPARLAETPPGAAAKQPEHAGRKPAGGNEPSARIEETPSTPPIEHAANGGAASPESADPPSHFLIDTALAVIRRQLTGHFVQSTATWFAQIGHYGLYIAMVMLLIVGFSLAASTSNPLAAFTTLGGVLVLAMLQYAAGRFLDMLHRLNRSTPAAISSTALPDTIAVLNIVVGLVALVGLSIVALRSGKLLLIAPAVVTFILCQFVAAICLNLHSINLAIYDSLRGGMEAIGVVALTMKVQLRAAPVVYGTGVGWGIVKLAAAMILFISPPDNAGQMEHLLNAEETLPPETIASLEPADTELQQSEQLNEQRDEQRVKKALQRAQLAPASAAMLDAMLMLSFFAAVPLITYVGFVVAFLGLDLARAVLVLPARLEQRG